MEIAVVGTGYVGLVTGTCLAETGNNVICVDIDLEKIKMLRSGKVPIYEPMLDTLFQRNIRAGRLSFTTDLPLAVKNSKIIFLALPTPPGEDGSADLSYVLGVAKQLGKLITTYKVIVDKSTVPVGTAEKVRKVILKSMNSSSTDSDSANEDQDLLFDVVSNPEFLREGFAVEDFMKPDRVVVGTSSLKARGLMEELYKPYLRSGNPILFMDERSAELTKYAANSFLAAKITFMNEMANLCEKMDADVDQVRIGIGADDRIGKRFLFPGIGYGGSCFPKDVQALVKSADDAGYDFRILNAVMAVNQKQKTLLYPKMHAHFKKLKGKRIAVWGLAFKPDTDDIREAPALYNINKLLREGAHVTVFDPEAMENVRKIYKDRIAYAKDHYDALQDADALLICTEWSLFRTPDFEKISSRMRSKIIFDGRNLYALNQMKELGFTYYSIGRKTIK